MISNITHSELYRDLVVEHARAPRMSGRLEKPFQHVQLENSLCGDRIELWLRMSAGGTVDEIRHTTEGCALCIAAASMMCVRVVGLQMPEIAGVHAMFSALVTGESDNEALGDLLSFAGLANYPSRRRCALLPWEALQAALVSAIDEAPKSQVHTKMGVSAVAIADTSRDS